jgi:hypothetical protein
LYGRIFNIIESSVSIIFMNTIIKIKSRQRYVRINSGFTIIFQLGFVPKCLR